MRWFLSRLSAGHDRSSFKCGVRDIDRFLSLRAQANEAADLSRTIVATPVGESRVCGFYTLSNGSVAPDTLPTDAALRGVHYPVPTFHVGKLAVDVSFQRQGLGRMLLIDAICRSVRLARDTAAYAIDLHAVDDSAATYYLQFGFTRMLDKPNHLFLSMAQARVVASIATE